MDVPLRHLETAALNLIGLKEEKAATKDTQEGSNEEEMEEGVVAHENYYFREMEKEEMKRMEAELENEAEGEEVEEGLGKDLTQI